MWKVSVRVKNHKLLREAEVAAMKTDSRLRAEEARKWKDIAKASKDFFKHSGKT